ncbi:Uncharacterized NAD(P)/FAD-binding protein YdhS [Rhizobium sp. RU20A]|uniref:FAD/NAD(P)-binding protein n=1 Tax=Rhizobium sp. RU20A TaxID=1907412 RepID=UPI0009566406|nr:FAD/NAD(P)-binding protein [Rhizobium sp. RU20A]SIR23067.1 Uncharacterized NAD(P)/FAD-binding protein YdhS [Rhizobium sp. RU20A]
MTLVPASPSPSSIAIDRLPRIAIVGRGLTGMVTAIALLKACRQPFHLVLYDPDPKIEMAGEIGWSGSGLVNSRVRDLSIDPGLPLDFGTWLETDGAALSEPQADSADLHAFVSGDVFSTYAYQRFAEAHRARTDVLVQLRQDVVTAVDRKADGLLRLRAGAGEDSVAFDAVFLATGYGLRPASVSAPPAGKPDHVAVLGGGVHAVDRALHLLSSGAASHVTLISASGFLPQPHAPQGVGAVPTTAIDSPFPKTLRGVFRRLREAANHAAEAGTGWQGIMNDFRAHAYGLWQGLSVEERRRFKRHVKPIYDSHRNRLPLKQYEALQRAISVGAITVRKARVEQIVPHGVLLSTPAGIEVLAVQSLIDCRLRPAAVDSHLIRGLVRDGLLARDELDLGIAVDTAGRATGTADDGAGLFAMGPLGLGSLPDIDLAPQIVQQAFWAARTIEIWLVARREAALTA